MTYQEDFTLEKKYLNLLGKYIYNTETDKFGMITAISISKIGMSLKAYYDSINDDSLVFFEDFKKGTLKFTLIDGGATFGTELHEKYTNEIIDDIKSIFGEEFSEDMIIHVDDDKRKEKNRENEEKEVKNICGKLLNISKVTAEIFYDDYTSREIYMKYTDGKISETEMLYLVCNHLCEELNRIKSENLEYFVEKMNREHAALLVDYASRKAGIDLKAKDILDENQKETMVSMLDKLLDGFKEKYEEENNAT